jgi:hypothetical protein
MRPQQPSPAISTTDTQYDAPHETLRSGRKKYCIAPCATAPRLTWPSTSRVGAAIAAARMLVPRGAAGDVTTVNVAGVSAVTPMETVQRPLIGLRTQPVSAAKGTSTR